MKSWVNIAARQRRRAPGTIDRSRGPVASDRRWIVESILLALPVIPLIAIAVYLCMESGQLGFIVSCPLWSAALLLGVAALGFRRAAFWGLIGAIVAGIIGFIGGFCGAFIYAPDANLTPFAAIVMTGPIGALVGALGGTLIVLLPMLFSLGFRRD